jgi:hypothetical protein
MKIEPKTDAEYHSLNQQLFDKAREGKKLSLFELDFFCVCLNRDLRIKFPICNEYRFRDYYLRNLDYRPVPVQYQLTEVERQELDEFAEDWYNNVILNERCSQTLLHIRRETKKEIKQMSKEFQYNGFLVKSKLYQAKLKKILWMSRYIHFKIVYDFFLGSKSYEISIPSIFGEVVFNDFSLAHIYTRHYAGGEKQYSPDQSFFSPDIHFNSIHRVVILVLGWINKQNIPIKQLINKAISFKYKNEYYHLYLDRVLIQRKGHKGNISVLRVNTIFPINDRNILQNILTGVPHNVSRSLIIYEQAD